MKSPSIAFAALLAASAARAPRATVALLAATCLAATSGGPYEPEPVLRASEILPPELASGPHHQVHQEVVNDGYMNRFRIASDFGRFEAYGLRELGIRVQEIEALAELDRLSNTDLFVKGLESSAKATGKAVEGLVTEPEETLKAVPGGVKRMFKRAERAARKGAAKVEERIEDDEEEELADDAADAASATFKAFMGITAGERQWAQKLGTDPYTSNEILRREIKKAAKIGSAGGFVVRLAVPIVPGLRAVTMVSAIVWSKDPQELVKYNRERLAALGIETEAIDAFFTNYVMSPTQQTFLVAALGDLEGVADLSLALDQAAGVENADEARFLVQSAEMLAWLHENESPVARLLPGERVLVARTAAGSRAVMAPVDHLSWTEGIAALAARRTAEATGGAKRRDLYLLGTVSARCQQELEALGWKVHDRMRSRIAATSESAAQGG